MKKEKITVHNREIKVITSQTGEDYISLTDLAGYKGTGESKDIVKNWLRGKSTIEFLGIWEKINNPDFKGVEFDAFAAAAGSNHFVLSPRKWILHTAAIGLRSASGNRGGTFAHKDIAFEFASWISPEFKLYLIKEFQRLKVVEHKNTLLEWDVKRALTKINYHFHTGSIKTHIILPQKISASDAVKVYATEADVLNKALFGQTAQEWKDENKGKEGNMRDYANIRQLICLSNLEILSAEFIQVGLSQQQRLIQLNERAITQMNALTNNINVQRLESSGE